MQTLISNRTAATALLLGPALALSSCGGTPDSRKAEAQLMLRGTVVSASANEIVVKTDTNSVTVQVAQPFHVYSRVPSDLSRVKETSFIGVTTEKQPDGSERATEIHVFPEELRGLGEGSRMMTQSASAAASRMTNGAVSASRMSNGSVSSTNGSTLVVQYPGGSQTVTVPPNTPVTELRIASTALAVGDQALVLADKGPDGSLTSRTAVLTGK